MIVPFIFAFTANTVATQNKEILRCNHPACQEREREEQREVNTVLANFAIMLTSVINIAQNPLAMKEGLIAIANGLVNIAMLATKRGHNTQDIQKLFQSEEFIDKVNDLVRTTIESSSINVASDQ